MPEERPYAFISYSHRDSDQVMPVLDRLKRRDVAVWYDQGIEVGSEWPEFIAQALVGARCVIAFITPNSVASQNCRRRGRGVFGADRPFPGHGIAAEHAAGAVP